MNVLRKELTLIQKLEYLELENLNSQDVDFKKIGIFDENYNFVNNLNQFVIFEYDQFNFQKTISVRSIINKFIELQGTYHKEFLLAELEKFNIEEGLEDVCRFTSQVGEQLEAKINNTFHPISFAFKVEIEHIILDSILLFIRLTSLYLYTSNIALSNNSYNIKRFSEIEKEMYKNIMGVKLPETFDNSLIAYRLEDMSSTFGVGDWVITEIVKQSKIVVNRNNRQLCDSYVRLLVNAIIIQNKGVYI